MLLWLSSPGAHSLLLTGLALAAIFASLTSLFIALATSSSAHITSILHWLLGGMHQASWTEFLVIAAALVTLILLSYTLLPQCEILVLGRDVAHSLGVRPERLLILTVLLIASFEGVSLSLCGAMSFVGLIVPHLTRTMVGPRIKPLFLCSMLNGATLVVLADLLSRTLNEPAELPLGVILALVGAPFFLLQLRSRQYQQGLAHDT
jgi:iron complex transport system permease protein